MSKGKLKGLCAVSMEPKGKWACIVCYVIFDW